MSKPVAIGPTAPRRGWLGWGLAGLGYLLMAVLATWPVAAQFGAAIPGELTDPLEHLWIMRWLRSCLLEGRNPLFCPEIQAPVGVPLGYFPTLHLQTVLYILLRVVTANDAAIFTTIWFVGFVATGLASFGLARWAIPGLDRGVAWVAGLGVMLCGPMLMHAHGHLETMQLGVVPPFLIAWIRFNDRPGWQRLVVAVVCYLLVTAAAPYFAVLAIFPAAWYSGWQIAAGWRRSDPKRLIAWLIGFGVIVLPGVALIFGPQVWAAGAGFPMTRSKRSFVSFGAPLWSGFVPSPWHPLGRIVAPDLFESTGYAAKLTECSSYLGLVPLALLGYAALARVAFPRRGFWWATLGLMVVFSWGARLAVGGVSIPLPAGWLYPIFPPFHLIRVPARFNLFAAAVAVVPAAAALRDLAGRVHSLPARLAVLAILTAATGADLAMVPFPTAEIPDPPALYAAIKRIRPDARVLDAPLFDANEGQTFSSLWGYWQQRTGLATSGGYPGLTNTRFDAEIARPSEFAPARMRSPAEPPGAAFAAADRLNSPGRRRDRAWIELTAHGFDYLVLHRDRGFAAEFPGLDSLARDLAEAECSADPAAVVIARDRLAPPTELTWTASRGFRPFPIAADDRRRRFAALREASLTLYQPAEPRSLGVTIALRDIEACGRARVVRLVEGERELGRWTIETGPAQPVQSPPLPLAPGLHTWTFRSDGEGLPSRRGDRLDDGATPYSFRFGSLTLAPAQP